MNILELSLIGISLGMDSFAVAVCKGLSFKKMSWKKAIIIGIYFAICQAIMPLMGYLLGIRFENFISKIDNFVIFILLLIVGGKMIYDSFHESNVTYDDKVGFKSMIILGLATSIDALAVGITFRFLDANILLAISLIGIITFLMSITGVKIGNVFGSKYKQKAELIGRSHININGIKIFTM